MTIVHAKGEVLLQQHEQRQNVGSMFGKHRTTLTIIEQHFHGNKCTGKIVWQKRLYILQLTP